MQMTQVEKLRTLADFRYRLRQFLQFSERKAAESGLEAQQYQLLLQIAGAAPGIDATVSYAAERLGLRHHSVVELSKRCEEAGLIVREHQAADRRFVMLHLTVAGQKKLRALSEEHARELHGLLPELVRSLRSIQQARRAAPTAQEKSGGQ
jgi:DNA-binding MarR family transcriptional regulator